MPPQAGIALRKIWLTMDIATNAKRVGLMHNEKFWTDEDLWMATMVFIKLDMRLTDPVDGNGEVGLARLLWGQRSLTTMWRFLKGEIWTSRLEVLRAWVAHCWRPSPVNRDCTLLGLAPEEVGAGELEGWGVGRKVGDEYGDKMLRVDQLVAQETVRRDMHLEREVMTMFLWGWVDPETGNNLPIPAKEEENPDEQWSDSTCSDDDDIDGMEDVEGNRDDVPEVDSDGENSGAPQIAFDYGLI